MTRTVPVVSAYPKNKALPTGIIQQYDFLMLIERRGMIFAPHMET